MHPRITVTNAFPKSDPLEQDLARARAVGVQRLAIHGAKLDAAGPERMIAIVQDAGIPVTHIVHRAMFTLDAPDRWPGETAKLVETIDVAATLGVPLVYGTSGPGGALAFEDAVDALGRALPDARAHAAQRGVGLLLETTNPQFADIDIFHTLRDTVAGAERVGVGICLDIHASWTEPGLHDTIRRAVPTTRLVQVGDYLPGTRDLDRVIPGDGIIPLERIIGWILEAGYTGLFDLELRDTAGIADPTVALQRAIERLSTILEGLGA
jgi:sugar phosphate isomerase/epimerase